MNTEKTNTPPQPWQGKIACQYFYSNLHLDTTQVKTIVNSYLYALFLQGEVQVKFDKYVISPKPGDFVIFPPHISPNNIISVSEDYKAIGLIVSSNFIYDCPMVRGVFQTATFSFINDNNPILKLSEETASYIFQIFQLITRQINNAHSHTLEALHALYGLLLAELMNVIESQTADKKLVSQHSFQIFIEFNKLLRIHFREHHDITFYADKLNISPRYLSMVVKKVSHMTVATFINRHLMLEACWLLKTTDLSIQQISNTLHFADQASFSKFFKRLKSCNPLQYRRQQNMQ